VEHNLKESVEVLGVEICTHYPPQTVTDNLATPHHIRLSNISEQTLVKTHYRRYSTLKTDTYIAESLHLQQKKYHRVSHF
jgi:hypothetical protein